ncbi:MAG: PrgI family protein [Patescibacteria group bacterium]|nr:PrgI family protein [Patescibacteria group bacterium]
MPEDKSFKIDIPESIEGYKVTLFWGLGLRQIVLVFIATLFVGLGVFSLVDKQLPTGLGMFALATLSLCGIAEIHGRNFYRHLLFIFFYYKNQPKALIYHHHAASGTASFKAKQLVYQEENHMKTFIIIFIALALGLLLLAFIGNYLSHVIYQ